MSLLQDASPVENCTYRYSNMEGTLRHVSLWLDGPSTMIATILALWGAKYAIKFLLSAGLNCHLTAALYFLCLSDSSQMLGVLVMYSLEANSEFFWGINIMSGMQRLLIYVHSIVAVTTSLSTMLVVYITFLRLVVIFWPMKFPARTLRRKNTSKKYSSNEHEVSMNGTSQKEPKMKPQITIVDLKKRVKPYMYPLGIAIFCIMINYGSLLEYFVIPCYSDQDGVGECLSPTPFRFENWYQTYRTLLNSITQTVVPVSLIFIATCATEYRVYLSFRSRRTLFDGQRNRCAERCDQLKEKMAHTVGIFIAVKFLILRSMPVIFDIYEMCYGIEQFGTTMSILVRVSDFCIILNTATNCLAYFGKMNWVEKKLRQRILKKEATKADKELLGRVTPTQTRVKMTNVERVESRLLKAEEANV
ncbi:hypothetical protein QR680_002362 [Steinernema hermaphroditum]|uniref:G-protein coupled receptors family 1 profile domain-containing protein n=1 Tax=Steinernema hermaphroditum TaxID=289476 RepID=A0AA39LHK9_9BILA|nr:hypothetical protein QR680_002362 [Steinernema hermaphroditum]